MDSIGRYLSADHRRCDDLLEAAQEAARRTECSISNDRFRIFAAAMQRHFAMEERVLFPSLEVSGGGAPIEAMRAEHAQMRELLAALGQALARGDPDTFLDLSETLVVMMQQHHLKEEQVLYPLGDRLLAPQAQQLVSRMQGIDSAPVT